MYQKIWEEKNMMVVGQVTTREEAEEIAYIRKIFVVGNRVRSLATKTREE